MIEPGITDCGSASQRSSVPSSHTIPPLPLAKASEYLNSPTSPALRPTTPNRFGPCRFPPSAAATWQVPQDFLNCASAPARSTESALAGPHAATQPNKPRNQRWRMVSPSVSQQVRDRQFIRTDAQTVLAAYYNSGTRAGCTRQRHRTREGKMGKIIMAAASILLIVSGPSAIAGNMTLKLVERAT